MVKARALSLVLCSLLAVGCGDEAASPVDASPPQDVVVVDVGPSDAGSIDAASMDAGPVDSGAQDSGPSDLGVTDDGTADAGAVDAGPTDVGPADAGRFDIVGTVGGACGTIASMLSAPTPSLVEGALVFMSGDGYVRGNLSPDGQRVFDTANAGGSSSESEVMSFELLHHCEGARLLRTETEIRYRLPDDSGPNSITDILVEIGGRRVGVSVTRAWRPSPLPFGDAEVRTILVEKLNGVNRSSQRVLPEDRWVKQVLHVWVASAEVAASVRRVWMSLDASLRADTIVLVTQTAGGGFIYCNPDPPLGQECPPIM